MKHKTDTYLPLQKTSSYLGLWIQSIKKKKTPKVLMFSAISQFSELPAEFQGTGIRYYQDHIFLHLVSAPLE